MDIRVINTETINQEIIEVKHFGWAVFPIFTEDGYINSGMFQLPIYEGALPIKLIPTFGQEDCQSVISKELVARKPVVKLQESASIFIRVVDEQQPEIVPDFNPKRVEKMYLPTENRSDYVYDAEEAAKGSFFGFGAKPKPFSAYLPDTGERNLAKWRRDIAKKITNVTGIKNNL